MGSMHFSPSLCDVQFGCGMFPSGGQQHRPCSPLSNLMIRRCCQRNLIVLAHLKEDVVLGIPSPTLLVPDSDVQGIIQDEAPSCRSCDDMPRASRIPILHLFINFPQCCEALQPGVLVGSGRENKMRLDIGHDVDHVPALCRLELQFRRLGVHA